MDNPQERVIKKMINNIVEQNRPVFEKTSASSSESSAPASSGSHSSMSSEDMTVVSRKIEYGFNTMRADNAELRKMLDEIGGAVKMLRNDMDTMRSAVQQAARSSGSHASEPMGHMSPAPAQQQPRGTSGMGAPQYKKSEADEAYEKESGNPSHDEHDSGQPQARGFAKKEDKSADIDISKVFYYGKK